MRAKMVLDSIRDHAWGGKTAHFVTQYDDTIPEDKKFCEATPSGSMEMSISNPAALAQLELGRAYYVDFNMVPEAETSD